jgi:hypothetical protein
MMAAMLLQPLRRCCGSTTTVLVRALAAGTQGDTAADKVLTSLRSQLSSGPSFADFLGGTPGTAPEDAPDESDLTPIAPPGRPARTHVPLPPWIRSTIPTGYNYHRIRKNLRDLKLATVRACRLVRRGRRAC